MTPTKTLDGYDEFGHFERLCDLARLGGNVERFHNDVLAALGEEAERLRVERRAQEVYSSIRDHSHWLHARLAEVHLLRVAAARLSIDAAEQALAADESETIRILRRVEGDLRRHDPAALKTARMNAAPTEADRNIQKQIPAVIPYDCAPPTPEESAARRSKILPPSSYASGIRTRFDPPPFQDPHLHAIDRAYMPKAMRVVRGLVLGHVGEALKREAAREFSFSREMPDDERIRLKADRQKWFSGRVNKLTCDLVRVYFPIWGLRVTAGRVREAAKRWKRRAQRAAR